MRKMMIILLLILSSLLGFLLSLYIHRDANQANEHLGVPVMQSFHYPATFVKQIEGDPEAGKKIFNMFCATCHNDPPMIDVKAPRIGDKKIWKALNQLEMPMLLKVTIEGRGRMPARGGCFECSDEQLKEAIQYILNQSIQNSDVLR